MQASEVFPNAPLQLVVLEVVWSTPRPPHVPRSVIEALLKLFPEADVDFAPTLARFAPVYDASEGRTSTDAQHAVFQLVARDRTLSVTLWPSAILVESSAYDGFVDFRAVVDDVLEVICRGLGDLPVTRVGLRYLDEIHVPGASTDVSTWAPFVAPSLLALSGIIPQGPSIAMFGGGLTLSHGSDRYVNFRFALTEQRIESSGPLRLRARPATPCLILDTDGFWMPGAPEVCDASGVTAQLEQLYAPTHELFDLVLTDACRETFRGPK